MFVLLLLSRILFASEDITCYSAHRNTTYKELFEQDLIDKDSPRTVSGVVNGKQVTLNLIVMIPPQFMSPGYTRAICLESVLIDGIQYPAEVTSSNIPHHNGHGTRPNTLDIKVGNFKFRFETLLRYNRGTFINPRVTNNIIQPPTVPPFISPLPPITKRPDKSPYIDTINVDKIYNSNFFNLGGEKKGVNPLWTKFTMPLLGPHKNSLLYQNVNKEEYHYEFNTKFIEPFIGMDSETFSKKTLLSEGRQAILGALYFPPNTSKDNPPNSFSYQIVGADPFSAKDVKSLEDNIRKSMNKSLTATYIPTYEQLKYVNDHKNDFDKEGINIGTTKEWGKSNQCYVPSSVIGRLVYVPTSEINEAYLNEKLTERDILVTDHIPAEIPRVGGIITFTPAVPNSHVSLLAQQQQTPFVYVNTAQEKDWIKEHNGKLISMELSQKKGEGCKSIFIDQSENIDSKSFKELWRKVHQRPPINYPARKISDSYILPMDNATVFDVSVAGGKARGYSILRKAVPNSTRKSMAITFKLWEEVLVQNVKDFRDDKTITLKELISQISKKYDHPLDEISIKDLDTDLKALRKTVKNITFNDETKNEILNSLIKYFPKTKNRLRFRSSSNVEDGDEFSGAGIYDSKSGCLEDDIQKNTSKKSLCDENKKSKSVFKAISKVLSSYFNLNAFLERKRYGVKDHDHKGGMAILVHHSYKDEEELANSVVQVEVKGSESVTTITSLPGSLSATNPDTKAIPEILKVKNSFVSGTSIELIQKSNLWDYSRNNLIGHDLSVSEYIKKQDKAIQIFESENLKSKAFSDYKLDLELKLMKNFDTDTTGTILLKQIRKTPKGVYTKNSDIQAITLPTSFKSCTSINNESPLLQRTRLNTLLSCQYPLNIIQKDTQKLKNTSFKLKLSGTEEKMEYNKLSDIPGLEESYQNGKISYSWVNQGSHYQIQLNTPPFPEKKLWPIVHLDQSKIKVQAQYKKEQLQDLNSKFEPTYHESVTLEKCSILESSQNNFHFVFQNNDIQASVNLFIDSIGSSIYNNSQLGEVTIQGISSKPIILKDPFSKVVSYSKSKFLLNLTPSLDSTLGQEIKEELKRKNIKNIYLNFRDNSIIFIGFNNDIRSKL